MNNRKKTRRLAGLSMLAAIVIVLQLLSELLVRLGSPFPLSLVLVPIVIGAALYGVGAGAILGAVFGAVVSICTVTGYDASAYILFTSRPAWTIIVIMLKATCAGLAAGLVYRLVAKTGHANVAVFLSAIVAPIVNTGIFCLSMVTLFRDSLIAWAGGTSLVYFIFIGLIGINFLIEMGINVLLSPTVVRALRAMKKEHVA